MVLRLIMYESIGSWFTHLQGGSVQLGRCHWQVVSVMNCTHIVILADMPSMHSPPYTQRDSSLHWLRPSRSRDGHNG
jgi:hypothetical protein